MKLHGGVKIHDLLKKYPFLKEFLVTWNPSFEALNNPLMVRTLGRVATISKAATIGGVSLGELLRVLGGEIERKTGVGVEIQTAEGGLVGNRIEELKKIIRELHDGAEPKELKARFHDLIKDVAPWEIARMEQSLIDEGMPEDEVKVLCGVHVEVFRESLEKNVVPGLPAGHPVHTLMLENREAESIVAKIEGAGDPVEGKERFVDLLDRLAQIDRHYLKKENQLFPLLETRGISGPSKVMWALDDDIRKAIKTLRGRTAGGMVAKEELEDLVREVRDMIYKEEHILFPMALEALSEEDWAKVAAGEEEVGYAWVEPEQKWQPAGAGVPPAFLAEKVGSINLDTGQLSPEQVNLLLTHLPVDISFVNEKDEVAYYSQTPERIFPRSPGIIGRRVQNCHPPKSVSMVEKILEEFKSGRKDVAEFWIQLQGKFLHIRYFAVRDGGGAYRGTLEVSQDVTGIRSLEGERRLLDWK
jgi:DUF438 domain-containing protein